VKTWSKVTELEVAVSDHRNMTTQTMFIPINIIETGITVHGEKSIFDHRILLFCNQIKRYSHLIHDSFALTCAVINLFNYSVYRSSFLIVVVELAALHCGW
jgi:hypothetical protein